jgi:hypothetical protein
LLESEHARPRHGHQFPPKLGQKSSIRPVEARGEKVMAESGPQSRKYGVAIVANDKVADWLLPFLESYVATNAATPLYIIPYDDNLGLTRRAAAVYGAHIVTEDSSELDALATRLYPLYPGHRRRLRKFLSLALPLDEVIYVDVDTILFADMSVLFGKLDPGKVEFIVASSSDDYVYNKTRKNYDFLREARLYNDGFFVTSRKILSLHDFYDVIAQDEAIFHAVRKRGMLFAQPLSNFVTHRRALKIASISECVKGTSDESFYKAKGVSFDPEGPVDYWGQRIMFAHWAGARGLPGSRGFFGLTRRRVFDSAWLDYARLAASRLEAAA